MAKKKTTRKKVTRKTAVAAKAPVRRVRLDIVQAPRTKAEFFRIIAENTELTRKQVADVFDVASHIVKKDLSKSGPGVVNMAGMMKVSVQRKPATRARKGTNPFTGEEMMFKAKPARNVVKVRPLKALKDLV